MKEKIYSDTSIHMGDAKEYSHRFTVNNAIQFIESLTLEIIFDNKEQDTWTIGITSPDGKKSKLQFYFMAQTMVLLYNNFLGSRAEGQWQVNITRPQRDIDKGIKQISLTFRGH